MKRPSSFKHTADEQLATVSISPARAVPNLAPLKGRDQKRVIT